MPPQHAELFADAVPRTADNFRALCTGEAGACNFHFGSPPLHFKGSRMHRIVPGQLVQGGDITSGDGRGGESIYGKTFEDESFAIPHDRKGLKDRQRLPRLPGRPTPPTQPPHRADR